MGMPICCEFSSVWTSEGLVETEYDQHGSAEAGPPFGPVYVTLTMLPVD